MGYLPKVLSILAVASASVPSNFAQGPQAQPQPQRIGQKAQHSSVIGDGSDRPDIKAKTKASNKSDLDDFKFIAGFFAYNAVFISSIVALNLFNRQPQHRSDPLNYIHRGRWFKSRATATKISYKKLKKFYEKLKFIWK